MQPDSKLSTEFGCTCLAWKLGSCKQTTAEKDKLKMNYYWWSFSIENSL